MAVKLIPDFILIAHAAQTAQPTESAGGIAALGLDWKALLFQIFNFAILLWILKRFAYKPIVKTLEERRQRIEEGLATAEKMKEAERLLAAEHQAILRQARTEAENIIKQSLEQGHKLVAEAEERAQTREQQLLAETDRKIEQATTKVRQGLRDEMVTLVTLAVEQIIETKLDTVQDHALVKSRLDTVMTRKS